MHPAATVPTNAAIATAHMSASVRVHEFGKFTEANRKVPGSERRDG